MKKTKVHAKKSAIKVNHGAQNAPEFKNIIHGFLMKSSFTISRQFYSFSVNRRIEIIYA